MADQAGWRRTWVDPNEADEAPVLSAIETVQRHLQPDSDRQCLAPRTLGLAQLTESASQASSRLVAHSTQGRRAWQQSRPRAARLLCRGARIPSSSGRVTMPTSTPRREGEGEEAGQPRRARGKVQPLATIWHPASRPEADMSRRAHCQCTGRTWSRPYSPPGPSPPAA